MKDPLPIFNWSNIAPPYQNYDYFRAKRKLSLTNAGYFIDLATLSYSDPLFAVPVLGEAGFKNVWYESAWGTQCYMAEHSDSVVVAFRGTQSNLKQDGKHKLEILIDFWTDLECFMQRTHVSDVCVHEGFDDGLDSVWDVVRDYVGKRQVWFTGHSMGAALATLAAWRMRGRGQVNGLVTFGSPRVGNQGFQDLMDAELYPKNLRFVHGCDGVPQVPPLSFGYRHVGKECLLPLDRMSTDEQPKPEKYFRGCVPIPRSFVPIPRWIYDHIPVLYAWHIWNWPVQPD